jgi:hypothetical protein
MLPQLLEEMVVLVAAVQVEDKLLALAVMVAS